MPSRDSVDKVISVYLASVCAERFSYKGIEYFPKTIVVSPKLFRGFTCPNKCGGCCPKFTLDYLPQEKSATNLLLRNIVVSDAEFELYSDLQMDNKDRHCRFLGKKTGRCDIYLERPFSCDFELIRFISYQDKVILTQKLYGRGWAMRRVDGRVGALCTMLPATAYTVKEVRRKLVRLREWANHFGVKTRLDDVIAWVESGPHPHPLRLSPARD